MNQNIQKDEIEVNSKTKGLWVLLYEWYGRVYMWIEDKG